MKCFGKLMLVGLAACLATGCGDSSSSSDDEIHHPKYPDLFVTLSGADGLDGGAVWYERDDGYETYNAPRSESTKEGIQVVCKPVYTGTSDAGDAYELDVTIGEARETKTVTYAGTRLELELTDGVTLVFEPDPL